MGFYPVQPAHSGALPGPRETVPVPGGGPGPSEGGSFTDRGPQVGINFGPQDQFLASGAVR